MLYIQRRDARQLETVDEFSGYREAVRCLREYRMGDPAGTYYLSTRACRAWREAS
jgi:hypothetical protein